MQKGIKCKFEKEKKCTIEKEGQGGEKDHGLPKKEAVAFGGEKEHVAMAMNRIAPNGCNWAK